MQKTRFAIIATEKDIASRNIANKIIELGKFTPADNKPYKTLKRGEDILIWHPEDLIYATDLSQHYDPECFVFVFRHLSEKNTPMLSVHPTGNLTSDVRRAGNPYELGIAHPQYMMTILRNLQKHSPQGYVVSYEATHHSPTNLTSPLMFVEIGSTEEQWNDPLAIEAVAKSVLGLLEQQVSDYVPCIGLGGGHYAERFTRRSLDENLAFGHIIPSYEFGKTNMDVIQQMIDKTVGMQKAVLDKKSQGKEEERQPIINFLSNKGIEIIKLK